MTRSTLATLAALTTTAAACSAPSSDFIDPAKAAELSTLSADDYVAGAAIACFEDDAAADRVMARFDLEDRGAAGACRSVSTSGDALDAIAELRGAEGVRMAEPDVVYVPLSLDGMTADATLDRQWHLAAVGAPEAWTRGATGAGVVVAVLDTGVSTHGIDTPAMLDGYDFGDDDRDARDGLDDQEMSHGTHVAGTIAQPLANGHSGAGIAPDAVILPVRVLGPGWNSSATIANGIDYAVEQGADVINMSLGGGARSATVAASIAAANEAGVVVVAASGNDSLNEVSYPAAEDGVLAVGSTRMDGELSYFSNTGDAIDLVAPGGDCFKSVAGVFKVRDDDRDGAPDCTAQETTVHADDRANRMLSTVTADDGYEGPVGWGIVYAQGTSMASPQVAAVAALLVGIGADREQVEEILIASSRDLGAPGWDQQFGHGEIDAEAAVRMAQEVYGLGGAQPDDGGEEEADIDTGSDDSDVAGTDRLQDEREDGGAGCSTTGGAPSGLAVGLLAAVGLVTRRRMR